MATPATIADPQQLVTRRATIALATVNAEARTAEMIWTTGSRALRGIFERYYEELSLEPKHVRMDRLTSGRAPLLLAHRNMDPGAVIGVVESARIERGRGVATVRFSAEGEAAEIFRKVQDGILTNVSVGYRIHKFEKVEGGEDEIPTYRAVDWEPFELSVVALGEDAGAHFRAATLVEEPLMNTEQQQEQEPTPGTAAAERKRYLGIRKIVTLAKLDATVAEDLIERGVTLDQARELVLDRLAQRDDATRTDNNIAILPGGHEGVARVALMAEALAARFGGPAPSNEAREFTGLRVLDLARMCLEVRGMSTQRMAGHEIVKRSMHGTSDFPQLLTEAGNRILRAGYDSYQGGVRRICRESTAVDFRPKSKLNLSEAPALLKVNEHGEIKRGTVAEAKESYSLSTWARIFSLTRNAIINDDLGAFADFASRQGRAAAELIASELATLLASNPTLSDSVALFHATHKNLGTTGAISITTLTEGLKLMRLAKGLDGTTPIDVTPKYLVVPAALEVVARQNVATINATKSSDVNPFTADLEPVVDPRLDAHSATAWYLAADPSAIDTIEYSFLDGAPGPQFESKEGFDVLGLELRVVLDFGCGVIDHRGLFKNAGA